LPRAIRDGAPNKGGVTFVQADNSEHFYSFARLAEEVDRRGMQLLATGLKKGDRVGFVLPDNEDFILSFLGALAVGVIPIPMYPPLSLGRLDSYIATASRILGAAEARALLTDSRTQSVLWSLVGKVGGLDQLLCVDKLPDVADDARPDLDAIGLDDICFLQFTSGSTAEPKSVVVTHATLLANLNVIMRHGLAITPEDVAVSWLPLYHDMGLIGFMLAPLWYSVPTVYLPTLSFVKHPTLWMETVHRHRGTITFAPNFAFALAARRTPPERLAQLDLSCIKALGCGAEPNHPGTLRAFLDRFAAAKLSPRALLPCYGMAEATLAMTFNPLGRGLKTDVVDADVYHDDGRAVPAPAANGRPTLEFASCGTPLPGHRVSIVDHDGRELPERSVGEILFAGPSVGKGYYKNPEASEPVFSEEGLHTGDLGYIADGEVYVTGRKKDLIILNGRNYDPQSIEWEVAEVAGIRKGNVVAFSRPGEATEELVVVAEAKTGVDRGALAAAVRQRVYSNLFLRAADVVLLGPGVLPKTSSGKLQRSRTRQQYLEGTLGKSGVRTMGNRAQALSLAKHLSLSFMARLRHNMKRQTLRLWRAANRSQASVQE
jgi:fatty-acyl-CoA synthase